ncbi:Uncharacterised protein [Niallia circulans]|jgi:hypothetical protein|nr:Uncharacterised protein [Niallia circulans]
MEKHYQNYIYPLYTEISGHPTFCGIQNQVELQV